MVKSRKYKINTDMINSLKLVFQCFNLLFRPLFKGFLNLGQKCKNIFVGFMVQMITLKFAFEINWPYLWYLRLTCFCSLFGKNWRHQKDNSILTDLSNFRRVNNKCTVPPLTKLFDNLFFFKFQYGIIRLSRWLKIISLKHFQRGL